MQWGFNGRASQALGNTAALAFPNQGSIGGRTGLTQGRRRRPAPTSASNAVNLGVERRDAARSAWRSARSTARCNLDVALSALERQGQGRILSTPRVSTQNNIEAEITQGIQIPIQTVANNTVTVTFSDAALTLRVTPQITAANTVIMRIVVENASPDFSRAVNSIPPIDTQRATDAGARRQRRDDRHRRHLREPRADEPGPHAGAAPPAAARLVVQARRRSGMRAASCSSSSRRRIMRL